MRHGISGRKLNRSSSHRTAMFRNMVTSLLQHERIYTTVPKAKELRRWADWMITLGKRGDLHARRQALAFIRDKEVVYKVFSDLGARYQNRPGGYTRIVKVGYRRGDASPMCIIELTTGTVTQSRKVKQTEELPKVAEQSTAPKVEEKVSEPAAESGSEKTEDEVREE